MRLPRPRHPGTIVACAVAGLLLLVAVAVVAARVVTAPSDRIPGGTSIAGVPVGGLSEEDAVRAVEANAPPPPGEVEIVAPGRAGFPIRVPVARIAPRSRARAAVRQALERPSLGERSLREIGFGSDRDLPLAHRLDGPRADALIARVAGLIDRPARDASLRISPARVAVVPSQTGLRVSRPALRRRLARLPARVEVPLGSTAPRISDAAARSARAQAAAMVARAATVRGAGASALLPRPALRGALRATPSGSRIAVSLDPAAIGAALAPAFAPVVRKARSATFRIEGGRVAVVPSQTGRRLDAAAIARALERGPRGAVAARFETIAPARSTADAQRMRIREPVGEFTTPYGCCQPRVTNIRRAAAILDRMVIPAGATFSLNQALGERTRARGFVPAPQINAGEYEDAVGGGVSQIATTVYNAAFFAGLRIVTHTPHEFWIARYPRGREATVSWGGPELIFENDWPAAILVQAIARDDGVTIRFHSAGLGRRVTTATRGSGAPGTAFKATTTRKVYEGTRLRRDESFTWTYKRAPAE